MLQRYPVDLLSNPLDVTGATLKYRTTAASTGAPACAAGGTGVSKATSNAFASLVTKRLTPLVLLASLLLAFVFGVVHALGPGHGKTITAAYLVGAGARAGQAVGVGAAVALMHTASVLALGLAAAALSSSFPSERIYPWLTVATGAFALSLGLAMLALRLRARRAGAALGHGHAHPWDGAHTHADEHVHEAMDHGHAHPDDHALLVHALEGDERPGGVATLVRPEVVPDAATDHSPLGHGGEAEPTTNRAVSRPRLVALAVSGGILPSPTALVVLLAAISAHRLGYGLALIVAFSLGLAAALIGIGVLALRARTLVRHHFGGRVASVLPILSAAVIVGFGVYFLVRGALQVGA
jgi:ABC-type nickel/cobalt efflux system permease component RcnA